MSNILSRVIGGGCDNQVITIDDGRDVIYMVPPVVADITWRPNEPAPALGIVSYRYTLKYFHVGRQRSKVWGAYVWDGMSTQDAETAIAARYL